MFLIPIPPDLNITLACLCTNASSKYHDAMKEKEEEKVRQKRVRGASRPPLQGYRETSEYGTKKTFLFLLLSPHSPFKKEKSVEKKSQTRGEIKLAVWSRCAE